MAYTILMIEDDSNFYENVNQYNKDNKLHYDIKRIKSTEDLQFFLRANPVDLVLSSWASESSKDENQIGVVKELRLNSATANIPIIVCSKKESFENQMAALDQGADDFYRKSAPLPLLYSKINATLRKIDPDKNNRFILMRKFFFLEDSLEVEHYGVKYKLSNKEFKILQTLCNNPGKVYSQEELNKMTSGEEVFVSKRCIDTFVTLLRKKIGKNCIISVRKRGYKLNEDIIEPHTEVYPHNDSVSVN